MTSTPLVLLTAAFSKVEPGEGKISCTLVSVKKCLRRHARYTIGMNVLNRKGMLPGGLRFYKLDTSGMNFTEVPPMWSIRNGQSSTSKCDVASVDVCPREMLRFVHMLFNEECNSVIIAAVAEGIAVDIEISPIRTDYDSSVSDDRAERKGKRKSHFDF
jgi:hypothetical protein